MRAFSCLFAIGVVVAAICSGTADEKEVKKATPQSGADRARTKTTNGNAPRSADKDKKDKPDKDKSGNQPAAKGTDGTEGDQAEQTADSDESEASNKYAAEEEAILKTGISFVKTYAEHDAKAVAAHFAPDAEYIDENAELFRGRAEIEASLEKFFKEHPKAQLALEIDSLRFLSSELAIEDGTTTCTQADGSAPDRSRYTAIHTKSDGQWLVASVREHGMHGKRLHSLHLRQLDWLVGNWVDEDEDSVVHFNCQMTDDGNYLVRDFDVSIAGHKVISGNQRIGWDPISGKLRAWTFDSDGGYFDGTWHRDGDKWVLTSTGVTADGQSAAGTAIFTSVDDQTITWQAVDREVDGARIEDSEEFTLVRTGPQPQKSDETDAK